ncbi:MAG: polysaccharide biosynthesis protein [Denitrovibrio sp.]|nr:MAG: polysaccharide biosynthesis protein [Denitrovibrio sp.]
MNLLKPTVHKRLLFFVFFDIAIFMFSLYFATILRFGFYFPYELKTAFISWLPAVIIAKSTSLAISPGYTFTWRFFSVNELWKTTRSLSIVFFIIFSIDFYFRSNVRGYYLPLGIIIIDFMFSFSSIATLRILKRFLNEILKNNNTGEAAVIIGARNVGEQIVRDLNSSALYSIKPVAFIDNDERKWNTKIHNVEVVGGLDKLEEVLKDLNITCAVIALGDIDHQVSKTIYQRLIDYGIINIKIAKGFDKLDDNISSVKHLHNINIEDLLSRDSVIIDNENISKMIEGKVIAVTGAGGSIGSEIVKQLLIYKPKDIIGIEIDETDLHDLSLDLDTDSFKPFICDIRNQKKLETLFQDNNIDILFHTAAYKHVPLMEAFPEEAVRTNIFATKHITELCITFNVDIMVNISTDKAVNPTSAMGATKKLAEKICCIANRRKKTKFISVRFGNVLGSRGSVIPIFLKQIERGGPVLVTDEKMERYFMSIPEAVSLVFQSTVMGTGGEVFILDMGEPVLIRTLAENLIKLNKLTPYEDIDIIYTGLRPGEKMYEELCNSDEATTSTPHCKVNKVVDAYKSLDEKTITCKIKNIERSLEDRAELIQFLLNTVD